MCPRCTLRSHENESLSYRAPQSRLTSEIVADMARGQGQRFDAVSTIDKKTDNEYQQEGSQTGHLDAPDDDDDMRQQQREQELDAAQAQAEQQMLKQALELSLNDGESQYDARAQQDLDRAVQQSMHDFEQETEHQAKIASWNSYIEDLGRDHARDKDAKPSERQTRTHDDGSVFTGHQGASRPPIPRTAVRDFGARSAIPQVAQTAGHVGSNTSGPSRQASQSGGWQEVSPGTYQASKSQSRPAGVTRSPPSPPLTIRHASAQSPVEEQRRHTLYATHPRRPPTEPSVNGGSARGLQSTPAEAPVGYDDTEGDSDEDEDEDASTLPD